MKRKQYSEEQIIAILKEAEAALKCSPNSVRYA